jgi:hypothetical protein
MHISPFYDLSLFVFVSFVLLDRRQQISGTQSTARNLQAKIHDLDQKSLKQQEMLYTIEFQVQQLERKVCALELQHTLHLS